MKKKFNSIDLVKFIMAFAVIAIHTQPIIEKNNSIYSIIIRMAVPFFFLATGFLLAIKIEDDKNNSIEIIKKYLIKTVKMYILWSIIYLPLAIYGYVLNGTPIMKALISYIKGFLLIGEHYNSWPLWYLLSTIYAIIVVLLFYKKRISTKKIFVFVIGISIISFGLDALTGYNSELPNALQFLKKIIASTIINGRILQGLIYIPLGIIIANRKVNKIIYYCMFTVGILFNIIIENTFISSYLLSITSIGLFGITKSIKLEDAKAYPIMRKMSTIIYLIHMYIWTIYYLIRYGQKTYGIDSFLITSIVSCIIAFCYIYLNERIKNKTSNKNYIT